MPIYKAEADLLFQIISDRHEKGSTMITTNLALRSLGSVTIPDSVISIEHGAFYACASLARIGDWVFSACTPSDRRLNTSWALRSPDG